MRKLLGKSGVRASGGPVRPKGWGEHALCPVKFTSATVVRAIGIEADLLTPLELDDTPVMDHELDRAVADCLQSFTELPEQTGGQRQRLFWTGL
jgi:hypothetical protein